MNEKWIFAIGVAVIIGMGALMVIPISIPRSITGKYTICPGGDANETMEFKFSGKINCDSWESISWTGWVFGNLARIAEENGGSCPGARLSSMGGNLIILTYSKEMQDNIADDISRWLDENDFEVREK